MNFPIFEYYASTDENFPRSKLIDILEHHPSNDLSDIDLAANYRVKQLGVNQKVKLILVYNKANLPENDELERMQTTGIRVSQGDKMAINHVLSAFKIPY